MKRLWKEIKEAFPFWFCKRIGGIIHTPWEMENRVLKVGLIVPTTDEINKNIEDSFIEIGLDPNSETADIMKKCINDSWESLRDLEKMIQSNDISKP